MCFLLHSVVFFFVGVVGVESFTPVSIFTAGDAGYAAFRIPGIAQLGSGSTLLAVAEGRKYDCDDFGGQHDIVGKRSTDGGRTWGELQVIADPAVLFGCKRGNLPKSGRCQFWDPTPVYDHIRQETLLVSAYASTDDTSGRLSGQQDVWMWRSKDLGVTWSTPSNISSFLGPVPRFTPANGHGIQLGTASSHHGRLVVPAYGSPGSEGGSQSAAFLSDDGGHSWRMGSSFGQGTAEGDIVELPENNSSPPQLMFNLRCENQTMPGCEKAGHCRVSALSDDGGETWHSQKAIPALPDPACKGGISSWGGKLVFANDRSSHARENVTVMISPDRGETWPSTSSIPVFSGKPAGYVDVFGTGNGAAVIFENATCSISFALVPIP